MGVEIILPKISIVTPSFNQGRYLEKTILSVLDQGYPNLEYIIIDGGSTDESVEIIKKYADRLTYWVSEPDRGQSHAINKGFERATGEIFGWLNSDDWYHPGALQAVAEAFAANPEAGAVVGAGEMVDEEGKQLIYKAPTKVDLDFLYHWLDDHFWQPSCFFTRQAWESCGPLDEKNHYAMDLALWIDIAKQFKYVTIGKLISYNLKHDEAKTTANGIQATIDAVLVIASVGNGCDVGRSLLFKEFFERDRQILTYDNELRKYAEVVALRDRQLTELGRQLVERDGQLVERERQLAERDQQLAESCRRVQDLLNSLSWKMTSPLRWLADKLSFKEACPEVNAGFIPYNVKIKGLVNSSSPLVVHALANFMTGGSSRLVVDIIEHLGSDYRQEVLTYFAPKPAHYSGVLLHEFGNNSENEIFEYFQRVKPDIVHVHYWGDVDAPWYAQVFSAAEKYGCLIIENVNTPVEPYTSEAVNRYVYVSDYVRNSFGANLDNGCTIYPGSNFSLFNRSCRGSISDDCVGMVYRLEWDKLNESAIDVFIKIVRKRPATKILIVGGGMYLNLYRQKVADQGLSDSFEFTGYVSYADLPALYEKMSIFVAPVWKESFGQVSPFAMNMEIPVIGYNVGALAEIIDDNRLLAPPGDSDALADIAVELLEDRERRLVIGSRNKQKCQQFYSVEVMVEKYSLLYKELLGAVE